MRYDWRHPIEAETGSPAYFEEIDQRFFQALRPALPWKKYPFEGLIDFENLRTKDVLEIGVGFGSHAQLIAPFCRSFTGIDLTERGSRATALRLRYLNLPARILCMDAEQMSFPDRSFDFIWSWGVIHHSADPLRILREMHRVLRPGGEAAVMVYHLSFLRRLLGGNLGRTDGALARHYRPEEWRRLSEGLFHIRRLLVTGQKSDLLLLPAGFLKSALERIIPQSFLRLFTCRLKWGSFLIAQMGRCG